MLICEKSAVRIAVEGNPHGCLAILHLRRDDLRMQGATRFIDITTVGAGMGNNNFAPETGKQLRSDRGGSSVGAVNDDTFAIERKVGDGGEQKANILSSIGFVDRWRNGLWRRRRRGGKLTEDLLFNRDLDGVGKLVTIRAKKLDTVVLPRIVRCRNYDSRSKATSVSKKRNGGGRNHSGVFNRRSPRGQPSSQRRRNPIAGLTRIHAQQKTGC